MLITAKTNKSQGIYFMSKEEELIKLLEKIEVPQIPLSDAIKTQISTVLAKIRVESSLLKGSQPSPVLFTPEEKKGMIQR